VWTSPEVSVRSPRIRIKKAALACGAIGLALAEVVPSVLAATAAAGSTHYSGSVVQAGIPAYQLWLAAQDQPAGRVRELPIGQRYPAP
jgi:hypothetical protein